MHKLAAAVVLTGMAAFSCFATEMPEDFSGIASQVTGDGSGIFNVPKNSAVYGTLIFNPSAFSPDPVAPSGSSYLDVFEGGAASVMLSLRDTGGSIDVSAENAFLEVSSSNTSPWALLVTGTNLSFSLILQTEAPVLVPPGTSLFDFSDFAPSTASMLLSDPGASLGFNVSPASEAPEPCAAALSGLGLAGLLLGTGAPKLRAAVKRRTIPGLRIPNGVTRVY